MDITYTGSKADLLEHLRGQATEAGRLSKAATGNEKHRQDGIKAGLERAIWVVERWVNTDATPPGHDTPASDAERHAGAFS
jgi:hypothetical protein